MHLAQCQRQRDAYLPLGTGSGYNDARPACYDSGLFVRSQCVANGYAWKCHCVDENTGTIVRSSRKYYVDFSFDSCIGISILVWAYFLIMLKLFHKLEDPLLTGRCSLAYTDIIMQGDDTPFYRPTCDSNGDYARKQCDAKGKGKKCWCVDVKNGKESRTAAGLHENSAITCDPPKGMWYKYYNCLNFLTS